jgi:hypothetical protein
MICWFGGLIIIIYNVYLEQTTIGNIKLKYFDKYWPVLQNILKYHLSYNTAMIFMLDISFLFMTLPEF